MAVALFSSMLLAVCVVKCAKERVQRCVYGMMKAFSSWDWWDGSHETQHSQPKCFLCWDHINSPKNITFYCNLMCDHIIVSFTDIMCIFVPGVHFQCEFSWSHLVSLFPPLKRQRGASCIRQPGNQGTAEWREGAQRLSPSTFFQVAQLQSFFFGESKSEKFEATMGPCFLFLVGGVIYT